MRLLHTSDWHLGRSFHQVGLLPAQEQFIDHLVEVVAREHVDVVAIAGDVYDRALPAPPTVALLDEALVRLTDAGAQVVLTSGNHDSAVRLGFGGRLLERSGVHLRTSVEEIARPVAVGGVRLYGVPYLEPSVTASDLGAEVRSHAGVLSAALGRITADAEGFTGPVVVLAHAFVTGGVPSDSERDISVGGVGDVPVGLFDGFDYVALGHLHGRQSLSERVRYAGSPLAMSFSEASHTKSTWLVDLPDARGGEIRVRAIEAPVHRALKVLRGTLASLLVDPQFADAEDAYCKVTLTDAVRPLDAMDRVRERFPYTVLLDHQPAGVEAATVGSYAARVKATSDRELFDGFLSHVRAGAGASESELAVVDEAIEGARLMAAERSER